MNGHTLRGLLATASMGTAYTIDNLQLFDLRLRILISICGLIVGVPTAIATLWHGYKAVQNYIRK
jgi:hypothetical protein